MIDIRTHPALIREFAKNNPNYERVTREVFQIGKTFQPLALNPL